MRAILLDPTDNSRKVIELEDGIQAIYDAIGNGCRTFTCPLTLDNGDAVYCDDEGLYNENIGGFMDFDQWGSPLVGRVLIVGTDYETGESVDCKSNPEDFRAWELLPANHEPLIDYFAQFN